MSVPIYEYLCSSCGQIFEQFVMRSDAVATCPSCPDASVEKQFSAFSFKGERGFVGSGVG
jgi:putative FmdB family regulatory protein